MIRLSFRDLETGKQTILVGLTDVNIKRLTDLDHDGAITLECDEMTPPGVPIDPGAQMLIFYATRERTLELAKKLGVDEKFMLDMLGEG